MPTLDEMLTAYPPKPSVSAADVAARVAASGQVLVVLDDDPTGTQSVADLPVLTRWEIDDFRWALELRNEGRPPSAIYVLTNTRSLDPDTAAARNRAVVAAALTAADAVGIDLGFVSRGDSTLRGHFPLEPDVIASTISEHGLPPVDGVVLVPAYPDAGRVTIGGTHYLRDGEELIPIAQTEFARDATFAFSASFLPEFVEEKANGRIRSDQVILLGLDVIRSGADSISDAVRDAHDGRFIVADAVTEDDLRALAIGLDRAERDGLSFLYRSGPPFVRARIGQTARPPLTAGEVYSGRARDGGGPGEAGGLIVVGSHVGVTTRQLTRLTDAHPAARTIEMDVQQLLRTDDAQHYIERIVDDVVYALEGGDVILHTSRTLVRTADERESLRISRVVSAAVVGVVNRTVARFRPRFVIAKGGITSSDVATAGLEIRRAMVRGPMLPGIVSLWEAVDGPAEGIPYVVFAGNVGDDDSLLLVARKLSRYLAE